MKDHILAMHQLFNQYRNDIDAENMKAYMKHQFEYFGIKTQQRRELTKAHNKLIRLDESGLLAFVKECLHYPEREMHHYALDTIAAHKKVFTENTICISEYFSEHYAWWDTVDMSNSFINYQLFCKNPLLLEKKIIEWKDDQNMWKRRMAIIAQLKFRLDTNTKLLEAAIVSNLNSKEFFINKAIGWALREYGDYQPNWVMDFVERTPLQPLSRREALRKIV